MSPRIYKPDFLFIVQFPIGGVDPCFPMLFLGGPFKSHHKQSMKLAIAVAATAKTKILCRGLLDSYPAQPQTA